jgi:isopentenyl-diphosphate delta-isomerase
MQANRIVSSDAEQLILVDAEDNPLGALAKADCHDGDGILHRAFSIFLFNNAGQLLLQKRSANKRLWPGYWSNSCCSHPRQGESMTEATGRRLQDELNIHAELEFVYKFSYQAKFADVGSEFELCSVYLGRSDGQITTNESEIAEARYVASAKLEQEFRDAPQSFTPWFKMEWQRLCDEFSEQLAAHTKPTSRG